MQIVLDLPDDWTEAQALILADRLEARELPSEVAVRVLDSAGHELVEGEDA